MMQFDSIWVPLFPSEKPASLKILIHNAWVLSRWFRLPIQWVIPREWKSIVPETMLRSRVVFIDTRYFRSLLGLLRDQQNGVLLLNAEKTGVLGFAQGLSKQKANLLENCQMPVWIVPVGMKMEQDPIRTIWVPISTEKQASDALSLALQLGNQHHLPVDIFHITSSVSDRECAESALGQVRDMAYHEYPKMLEEVLAQGSPYSSPKERQVIRHFAHSYGNVTNELKKGIQTNRESLMIFEWKGTFRRGHAENIRLLLRCARGPVLLVRETRQARSRLRIDGQFGAAR